MWTQWSAILLVMLCSANTVRMQQCARSGDGSMKHLWGDALSQPDCTAPDGSAYPRAQVDLLVRSLSQQRRPKSLYRTEDPLDVRTNLLRAYSQLRHATDTPVTLHRTERAVNAKKKPAGDDKTKSKIVKSGNSTKSDADTVTAPPDKLTGNNTAKPQPGHTAWVPPLVPEGMCEGGGAPSRLCATRYNTTAPMYGVSLTSGNPVTIVQKFPDLLQQVIFEVCESSQCDVLHGECVQTYTPHLFLVIPLGPVTLTGQDYVLVESGCVCRPKYAAISTNHPPAEDVQ